jgi:hypothetical protein
MPFLDARHPQVLTVASRHADIRVSRPRRTARIPDHVAAILFRPTVYAGWCESATQFDVRLADMWRCFPRVGLVNASRPPRENSGGASEPEAELIGQGELFT